MFKVIVRFKHTFEIISNMRDLTFLTY